MSLLYVVIFITALSIGSSLSNICNSSEKCRIFKHGSNITWPNTDIVKSVSSGYIFNATCGCTTSTPHWLIFINGSYIELSCEGNEIYDIRHKSHTYRSRNISCTITESTVLLCHNDCHQYSKPVFISVTQEGPKGSVLSSFPTSSPSLVPTCPLSSSTSLLLSSLFSDSPSHIFAPPQSLSLLSPFSSITSNAITSLTTTTICPCSSSIITIPTVFSTVIVTTPTCNVEATTTTSSNTSSSTNSFIIKTAEQTVSVNECTTTLLAAAVPSGGIVIVFLVLLVTAIIIICIVVKKYTKNKSTTIIQNTIPNDQL